MKNKLLMLVCLILTAAMLLPTVGCNRVEEETNAVTDTDTEATETKKKTEKRTNRRTERITETGKKTEMLMLP